MLALVQSNQFPLVSNKKLFKDYELNIICRSLICKKEKTNPQWGFGVFIAWKGGQQGE